MTTLDERLRRSADDIRGAATQTPLPSLARETTSGGHRTQRVIVVAAAAILMIGGLVVLVASQRSGSVDPPTAQPAPVIDRFIIDGMNVESAAQYADGQSSELWLNTLSDDPDSALPAASITTGDASFPELADWQRTGRFVEVLGQRVEVRSLNGDPLAITWTTPAGLPVTLVGEGLNVEEFEALIDRLRPMTETEWRDIAGDPIAGDDITVTSVLPESPGSSVPSGIWSTSGW